MKTLTVMFRVIALMSIAIGINSHSQNQTQSSRPVSVGEVGPDFTLVDQNGNKVTLSDARGKSPMVLVFYRGYW